PRRPRRSTLCPYTTLFRSLSSNRRIIPSPPPESGFRQKLFLYLLPLHLFDPVSLHRFSPFRFLHQSSRQNIVHGGEGDGKLRQRSEEHTSELQSRENLVCR